MARNSAAVPMPSPRSLASVLRPIPQISPTGTNGRSQSAIFSCRAGDPFVDTSGFDSRARFSIASVKTSLRTTATQAGRRPQNPDRNRQVTAVSPFADGHTGYSMYRVIDKQAGKCEFAAIAKLWL
jgi:hypothetical protein